MSSLKAIVGDFHVLTAAADTAPYLTDCAIVFTDGPRAVVRPGSTAEVAAWRASAPSTACRSSRRAAIPAFAADPFPHVDGDEIVLQLSRLNRVRDIDAANATMTVEAGVPLASVQRAAAEAGLLFPLSLAAEGSCEIGGKPFDQCRRHRRPSLRQCPRDGARPRNRARRRPGLEWLTRASQGQYRLRPEAAFPRQRRHTRHHHRGSPEAFPAAADLSHRLDCRR